MGMGNRTGRTAGSATHSSMQRIVAPMEKNWGVHEYDELLAGMHDPGALRQVDGRGMTPTIAAALDTGSMAHRLMSLLDEPEATEGESSLDRIQSLLEENLEVQKANGHKLDAILRVLAPRLSKNMGIPAVSDADPHGTEQDAA